MVITLMFTLTLAACGTKSPTPESTSRHIYIDERYGFSVRLPSRFAGDWWQGAVGRYGDYSKAWTAADSPVREGQPLDYFAVSVSDVEPRTSAEIEAYFSENFSDLRDVDAQFGQRARIIRMARTSVDGAAAVSIDGYIDDPFSGHRERMRCTIVLTPRHTYQIGAMSTPRTWRRNLPAFKAMLASFRLGSDDQ